jgi:hypothetical protein
LGSGSKIESRISERDTPIDVYFALFLGLQVRDGSDRLDKEKTTTEHKLQIAQREKEDVRREKEEIERRLKRSVNTRSLTLSTLSTGPSSLRSAG